MQWYPGCQNYDFLRSQWDGAVTDEEIQAAVHIVCFVMGESLAKQ